MVELKSVSLTNSADFQFNKSGEPTVSLTLGYNRNLVQISIHHAPKDCESVFISLEAFRNLLIEIHACEKEEKMAKTNSARQPSPPLRNPFSRFQIG